MPNKKMIEVRKKINPDTDTVKFIIAAATDELRAIYRPIKTNAQKDTENPSCIVAIINDCVVGVAEYFINNDNISVRGLAVSPIYRRQGVAKVIIEHIMLRAQKEGKTELVLNTIKETGNSNAFLHMGFTIVSEEVSKIFEGVQGEHVTLVNMSKKLYNNSSNLAVAQNAPSS